MAVLEEGIAAFLIADATIGGVVDNRIYPLMIPQGDAYNPHLVGPCLTYQRISTPRIVTHQSSGATGDLTNPRFQFDAWAATQKPAKAVSDALRAVLHGKRGVLAGGVTIRAAIAENEEPEFDPDSELYRSRSDYIIWIEEA